MFKGKGGNFSGGRLFGKKRRAPFGEVKYFPKKSSPFGNDKSQRVLLLNLSLFKKGPQKSYAVWLNFYFLGRVGPGSLKRIFGWPPPGGFFTQKVPSCVKKHKERTVWEFPNTGGNGF